jgi:hypothetical protein
MADKKKVAFVIPVVLMKDKSGNQSLLSNGVARTHFMPPDGACILTVLKPLQSLTGGSRLDALAKLAPDKSPPDQQLFGLAQRRERVLGAIYICSFLFTPFLTHLMFRIRFFVGMIIAAVTNRPGRLINALCHCSSDLAENFDSVFPWDK